MTAASVPAPSNSNPAARRLEQVRHRPPLLRAFLSAFPKGGDLHDHLIGSVYAEHYLERASELGYCFDGGKQSISPPPCEGDKMAVDDLFKNVGLYNQALNALSTRSYVPQNGPEHDRFFFTFPRFRALTDPRDGELLAEAVQRAAAQNILYLELMKTFEGRPVRIIGHKVGWDGDFERTYAKLVENGLLDHLAPAHEALVASEKRMRKVLDCDGPHPAPACSVEIRYIQQANRIAPPEIVFAQLAFAVHFIKSDPKVVGLTLVAPEDNRVALRDYELQMRMIRFLTKKLGDVPVTMHAGELALGLVPPADLRTHIHQAIEIAGVDRIGHGVTIGYEPSPSALMAKMAKKGILVETLLSSNEKILGIKGVDHPFLDYLHAGVPLAIATDDEGVSRSDLTHEYQLAVDEFGLSYDELKKLSRDSLTYSFLAGKSLWRDRRAHVAVAKCSHDTLGGTSPSRACAAFLKANDKARMEWRLEGKLTDFESNSVW